MGTVPSNCRIFTAHECFLESNFGQYYLHRPFLLIFITKQSKLTEFIGNWCELKFCCYSFFEKEFDLLRPALLLFLWEALHTSLTRTFFLSTFWRNCLWSEDKVHFGVVISALLCYVLLCKWKMINFSINKCKFWDTVCDNIRCFFSFKIFRTKIDGITMTYFGKVLPGKTNSLLHE